MTGNLIDATTGLQCPHGGRIVTANSSSTVLVDGRAVRTASDAFTVVGCPLVIDSTRDPCLTVRWNPPSQAVLVDGVPVLLDSTDGQCFGANLVPRGRPVARGGSGVSCR
ncbi:hypothetical protein E1161_23505 [Saccharopolyspora aridisoli]|uniref:Uncharacterized protein n=1 Tax=Saccharopolyspora aridisoli TaxID=2530385 RepID=A0A4R4UIN1_9PSEU|nr:hypothetical protein [Saccharopolyspora aridisoli]TDC88602.1 hypothetical protein E1161_23505 [Saccharopolyspora aridisoli]